MKSQRDNRIVVDLKKVQYARFYYRNTNGNCRNIKPDTETFNGVFYPPHERAMFHPQYPNESLVTRFKRRGIQPDIWTPELLLKLTANACLIYTGEKALSLWEAWKAKIYAKKK